MKQLGDRLRDLRESCNLKQVDVANALFISNKILSSYERNISTPTIENLKILCEFYNVSADYLLQIEPAKPKLSTKKSSLMEVTPTQEKFLSYYERLDEESKDAILGLMIVYYREQQRKSEMKQKSKDEAHEAHACPA